MKARLMEKFSSIILINVFYNAQPNGLEIQLRASLRSLYYTLPLLEVEQASARARRPGFDV